MSKRTRALFLAAALIVLLPSSAHAYKIYNKTGQSAYFRGEGCAHCYKGTIANGDSASCPGGDQGCRGETWISMETATTCGGGQKTVKYCPIEVDAHGWVEIYPGNKCVVYTEDGKPKSAVIGNLTVGGVDASGNPVLIEMSEHCGPKNDND